MRKTIDPQMKLGQVDISEIEFDLRSRDEIPKLLMGLQYIYCTPEIREQVFKILEEMVPRGRTTMAAVAQSPPPTARERLAMRSEFIPKQRAVLSSCAMPRKARPIRV